jgi:hypothetical protein
MKLDGFLDLVFERSSSSFADNGEFCPGLDMIDVKIPTHNSHRNVTIRPACQSRKEVPEECPIS